MDIKSDMQSFKCDNDRIHFILKFESRLGLGQFKGRVLVK